MENGNGFLTEQYLPPQRSSFLTILCVLSFIGSAYGIFRGITMITGATKIVMMTNRQMDPKMERQQREQLSKQKGKESKFALKVLDSASEFNDEKKIKTKGVVDLFASLLTLSGAILMWRMKRKGYLVYVGGIILWILSPIIVFGTGNFLAVLDLAVSVFAGLLFSILYAFNLKDMKDEKVL